MKNQWYLTPLPNAPDLRVTGYSETLFKPWIRSQPRSLTHDMKSLAQGPINKTGYPQALYSSLKDNRYPKTADPKIMVKMAAGDISSI